jgi:periplasmic protein TonB
LAEALLVLVVLTLGSAIGEPEKKPVTMTSVSFRSAPERKNETEQDDRAPVVQPADRPVQKAVEAPDTPTPVAQPPAQPPPAAPIQLTPKQTPSSNTIAPPKTPGPPAAVIRGPMGPVDTGGARAYADTARVGTAPGGQPLYAAAWYREPSDSELAGYLSTASGPGWGLIACRTAPDYRVEDCVALDEYPAGSQINRAVLAATWQFQVRPPRVGGTPKIGAWVRIRIDYGIRRRP